MTAAAMAADMGMIFGKDGKIEPVANKIPSRKIL